MKRGQKKIKQTDWRVDAQKKKMSSHRSDAAS